MQVGIEISSTDHFDPPIKWSLKIFFFSLVWNLRNEPVCTALIQPLSVKELQLYLDALKLEIPVSLLLEVDKICSSKFAKYPASELGDVEDEPTSQNV